MKVGRDDEAAARDFISNQFGREVFTLRDVLHFARDLAFAGVMDLRPNFIVFARSNPLSAIHSSIIED